MVTRGVTTHEEPDLFPTRAVMVAQAPTARVVHLTDAIEENPDNFLLASLGDRRLRVIKPFEVSVERENDDFIATAPEIDEFGFGENRQDAIRELQQAIVELYYSLKQDESRLGEDLLKVFHVLRAKVSPAQHA